MVEISSAKKESGPVATSLRSLHCIVSSSIEQGEMPGRIDTLRMIVLNNIERTIGVADEAREWASIMKKIGANTKDIIRRRLGLDRK